MIVGIFFKLRPVFNVNDPAANLFQQIYSLQFGSVDITGLGLQSLPKGNYQSLPYLTSFERRKL
jgi:hypothetical protein